MAHTATKSTPRLTPAKRAAEALGIPYTSLRLLAHRGEFDVVKVGRAWYLRTVDLDNWVERRAEKLA
jgi:excisionase family DNA binding protein